MNDTRRFGRNFGAIAFAQLVSQVLTLIISVVLARALGVEQYGVFVFALAFPSWFLLLTSLGMDAVLTIDVAADRSKARSYLTALVVLRIPLVLATLAVLWFFVQLTLSDPVARIITMILGTTSILTTYAGTFRSVFQAFERLEYGALVTIVERVITTAGVLVLLFLGFGLLEVSLVFLLGSIVSLGLLIVITRTRFVWLERRVDRATVTHIVRRTIPFALAAVVSTFLYTSGPVLLTILQDPSATGEFNAAFDVRL
ncbi:MAG: oligosaccharide flippase family protein, partial [Acidobacteriota bacterium]